MFDQKDIRRDITVAYYQYSNGSGDVKEVFNANPMGFNFAKWDQRYMGDKWLALNKAASGKFGYGINWVVMRYADVLLMAAEAEIEVGSFETARGYVNQVRARAKDPISWCREVPGDLSSPKADANYKIDTYNSPWVDKDAARTAVRFERRLELAQEGHRFFDLVRWGIAAETLNAYVAKEKLKRVYKAGASFTKGKHEYFPIPSAIIDLATKYGSHLDQNPGY